MVNPKKAENQENSSEESVRIKIDNLSEDIRHLKEKVNDTKEIDLIEETQIFEDIEEE